MLLELRLHFCQLNIVQGAYSYKEQPDCFRNIEAQASGKQCPNSRHNSHLVQSYCDS